MWEDAAGSRSCSIIFPPKLESKVVYGPVVEDIGGFVETGVNSRNIQESLGMETVEGWSHWGHTGFCGSAAE